MTDLEESRRPPFRRAVGMMVLSKTGRVLLGRQILAGRWQWQMPQGGIRDGESPASAALRELREEIGTDNVTILAESPRWISYELTATLAKSLWSGKYAGEIQKWFLVRYQGEDSDLRLKEDTGEFDSWKWIDVKDLLRASAECRHGVYREVLNDFQSLINRSAI
jgi:putative (di)nucleoside polyphosphate hydrolase